MPRPTPHQLYSRLKLRKLGRVGCLPAHLAEQGRPRDVGAGAFREVARAEDYSFRPASSPTAGVPGNSLLELAAAADGDLFVDVADVSFVDSNGVRSLLSARREVPDGKRIAFLYPSRALTRLLEVTGVKDVLHLE